MRIFGKRLIDLFDINAAIYVGIMIADVIDVYLRVLRRDGQPSRSHLVRRECRIHDLAFWLQRLICERTHDVDVDYGRRMARALRLVITRRAPVQLLSMINLFPALDHLINESHDFILRSSVRKDDIRRCEHSTDSNALDSTRY